MILLAVWWFVAGLILGSFINVLVARYQTGLGIGGRSRCLTCGHTLTARELVPVMSYVYQRGKCKKCSARVSPEYPIVEFLSGVYMLGVFLFSNTTNELLFFSVALIPLMVIAAYDLRHFIIPPLYAHILTVVALVRIALSIAGFGIFLLPQTIITAAVAMLFFYSLWHFSDGRAMGFGDVGLVASLALLFGYPISILGVVFSFWTGALVGIILLLQVPGTRTLKTEVPFGPFLVLGFYLAFIAMRLFPQIGFFFI